MKVSSQNTNMVNHSYGRNQAAATPSDNKKETGVTRNVDSVSLSSATKDLQKIHQAMESAPPQESRERSEKVATLKAAVESGQYKVDSEKVAEKMTEFFFDKIA